MSPDTSRPAGEMTSQLADGESQAGTNDINIACFDSAAEGQTTREFSNLTPLDSQIDFMIIYPS